LFLFFPCWKETASECLASFILSRFSESVPLTCALKRETYYCDQSRCRRAECPCRTGSSLLNQKYLFVRMDKDDFGREIIYGHTKIELLYAEKWLSLFNFGYLFSSGICTRYDLIKCIILLLLYSRRIRFFLPLSGKEMGKPIRASEMPGSGPEWRSESSDRACITTKFYSTSTCLSVCLSDFFCCVIRWPIILTECLKSINFACLF